MRPTWKQEIFLQNVYHTKYKVQLQKEFSIKNEHFCIPIDPHQMFYKNIDRLNIVLNLLLINLYR